MEKYYCNYYYIININITIINNIIIIIVIVLIIIIIIITTTIMIIVINIIVIIINIKIFIIIYIIINIKINTQGWITKNRGTGQVLFNLVKTYSHSLVHTKQLFFLNTRSKGTPYLHWPTRNETGRSYALLAAVLPSHWSGLSSLWSSHTCWVCLYAPFGQQEANKL